MIRPLLPRRVAAAATAALALGTTWVAAPTGSGPAVAAPPAGTIRPACATVQLPAVQCFARYLIPGAAPARSSDSARPVTPADLRAAYHLPASGGSGATVAIVDAMDDPKAESDLAVFRKRYGLPPCTTANGCFRKLNQSGDPAPLPPRDEGWGVEISLDLDAVSAACPACSILLLEGRPTLAGLGTAVNTAVRLGADVVSNSYGTNDEFAGMPGYGRRYYQHPGTPIVVSTGDYGLGPASFPAVLPYVISVGGTRLVPDPGTARGWRETAWRWASSGCSAYIAKPSWQHDGHCLMRTVADISADAAPGSGLLVADSFGFPGTIQVGGTSLSTPLISAMIALAGNGRTIDNSSRLYHPPAGSINDVVGGSNGFCGHDYLCTGLPGYDAPTGVGSPHGLGAL